MMAERKEGGWWGGVGVGGWGVGVVLVVNDGIVDWRGNGRGNDSTGGWGKGTLLPQEKTEAGRKSVTHSGTAAHLSTSPHVSWAYCHCQPLSLYSCSLCLIVSIASSFFWVFFSLFLKILLSQ